MAIVVLPDFNEFLDSMDEDEMGREIEALSPMHIISFLKMILLLSRTP